MATRRRTAPAPTAGGEQQTIKPSDVADLTTPGDDAEPKPKTPGRARRYRLLGQGEGDHCIYEITPEGSQLPGGTLVPIPEVPRFESAAEAEKWIRNESKDLLMGKQIMILRALEILSVQVESRPSVSITKKPKKLVSGPTESEE